MALVMIGLLSILAGIVVMVVGKVWIGLVLLFGGLVSIAIIYVKMMRGAGNLPGTSDPDGVPGHHASEREKMDQPVVGEQNASIWENIQK